MKPSSVSLETRRVFSAWVLVSPMLLILLFVAAIPLVRTFFFSFTDVSLDDLSVYKFVFFQNYIDFFEGEWYGVLVESVWWKAVYNTLVFALISVVLEVFFGLLVALFLNVSFKGRGLLRAAVLIPWAIPTIVSAKMWAWMLNDQFGIINDILLKLHVLSDPIAWTSNYKTSLFVIIMVDVWKTTPFMALLILAGLQTLPQDCYRAARVDGVHPLRVFFRVTLPLLRPTLVVAIIFRMLDALRVFDLIYVLTPSNESTVSMSVFARQYLFDFDRFAEGSAASTLLFLTICLLTISALRIGKVKLG